MNILNMDFSIQITTTAIQRVKQLIEQQDCKDIFLRISVESGGCSGFQYKYEFTDLKENGDYIHTQDQVTILIDESSQTFLNKSIVDYVQNLGSAYFEIRNPDAKAKCGCGNSFSI